MDFSAGSLFASLIVSTVGLALFRYGKKMARGPQLVAGLVLMVFPYFVSNVLGMLAIAAAVLAATWVASKQGL